LAAAFFLLSLFLPLVFSLFPSTIPLFRRKVFPFFELAADISFYASWDPILLSQIEDYFSLPVDYIFFSNTFKTIRDGCLFIPQISSRRGELPHAKALVRDFYGFPGRSPLPLLFLVLSFFPEIFLQDGQTISRWAGCSPFHIMPPPFLHLFDSTDIEFFWSGSCWLSMALALAFVSRISCVLCQLPL